MGRKLTLFKKEEHASTVYFHILPMSDYNEEWFSHVLIFKNVAEMSLSGFGENNHKRRRALYSIFDVKATSQLDIQNTRVRNHKHRACSDTKTTEKLRAPFHHDSVMRVFYSSRFGTLNCSFTEWLKPIVLTDLLTFKKHSAIFGRNDTGKSK